MLSSISSSDQTGINLRRFVASFAVVLLLIGVATEVLVRIGAEPQNPRPAHLRLVSKAQINNVAFGDSHVARGFDASGGFVNLAFPSENIQDMRNKAAAYFADKAPQKVIIQADPHLFAPYRLTAKPAASSYNPPVILASSERHRPRLSAYWRVFFTKGGNLVSNVNMNAAGALLSGGDLSQDASRLRLKTARSRLMLHQIGPEELVHKAQEEYRDLLDMLLLKGAEICLVTFPVSPDYNQQRRDWSEARQPHERAIAFFKNEAKRVGANYWDARNFSDDLTLYRDIDHLNVAGARLFSPLLLESCF